MARIRKENIKTPFFHIMVQGINKEFIFDSNENKNKYMEIMEGTKEKIDIMILAYCIMSNHAHILVHEQEVENITKYMHRVNLLYAKYYNKKHNRVGYVFRERYKTQPIYNENHLHTCVRYIHNNPVKAGLCEKANEYPYSSCYHNIFYTDTELERNIKQNMYNQTIEDPEEKFILLENERNKEQICIEAVKEAMLKNNIITKEDLYQNIKIMGRVIKELKNQEGISYRMMEEIWGINRKKLKQMEEEGR